MITRYCTCGAALRARSSPPAAAESLVAEFDRRHAGEGCEPTTAAHAARARRREELALELEEDA